jgi:hypothetical protein
MILLWGTFVLFYLSCVWDLFSSNLDPYLPNVLSAFPLLHFSFKDSSYMYPKLFECCLLLTNAIFCFHPSLTPYFTLGEL